MLACMIARLNDVLHLPDKVEKDVEFDLDEVERWRVRRWTNKYLRLSSRGAKDIDTAKATPAGIWEATRALQAAQHPVLFADGVDDDDAEDDADDDAEADDEEDIDDEVKGNDGEDGNEKKSKGKGEGTSTIPDEPELTGDEHETFIEMMKHDDDWSKSSRVQAFLRLYNKLTPKKKNKILSFPVSAMFLDVLEIALNKTYGRKVKPLRFDGRVSLED